MVGVLVTYVVTLRIEQDRVKGEDEVMVEGMKKDTGGEKGKEDGKEEEEEEDKEKGREGVR
jgi:hypothetical protein